MSDLLQTVDERTHLAGTNRLEGGAVTDQVRLILTDIEMPEMDGYVLTRKVKNDDRFKSIPVIMHSSLSAEVNQALGKGVGADAYVAKFEPQELAGTVAKVMLKAV